MSPFGRPPAGARLERMKASPLFAEGVFRNPSGAAPGLKRGSAVSTMRRVPVRRAASDAASRRCRPRARSTRWTRPVGSGLRATWLGHSTVLLEIDGLRVLTDPVWGDRASPFGFAGPKRFQPVPVPIDEAPAARRGARLARPLRPPRPRRRSRALAPAGRAVRDVARRRRAPRGLGRARRAASPSSTGGRASSRRRPDHHRGALAALLRPRLRDRNATLWSSFAVRGPRRAFFFSGDTGPHARVRRRSASASGPFDLVMLEVGAFHPSWGDIHLGPENALEALSLLGGGSVPARALGHVQPRDPRLGRAAETLLDARARSATCSS